MKIESCSPSRLRTFSDCTFKYYLSYELDLGDELSESPFASNYGKVIHTVLERYAKSKGTINWREVLMEETRNESHKPYDVMDKASKRIQASFFIDRNCYQCPFFNKDTQHCAVLNKNVGEFKGCPKILYEQALDMLRRAINRYDKYYKNGNILGTEYEFSIDIGKDEWGDPIIIHGIIDLVVEDDPETIVVIDYKTGFKVSTAEELMKDMQARMYSVAAKYLFPNYKFVLVTFDYFQGVPIEIAFTKKDDETTVETIKREWHNIKRKKIIKRRNYDWYCQYLCNRKLCDVEWAKLIDKNK